MQMKQDPIIQLTLWAPPYMTMHCHYGIMPLKDWLKREEECMISHGRKAEIRMNRLKEIALFVDKVA